MGSFQWLTYLLIQLSTLFLHLQEHLTCLLCLPHFFSSYSTILLQNISSSFCLEFHTAVKFFKYNYIYIYDPPWQLTWQAFDQESRKLVSIKFQCVVFNQKKKLLESNLKKLQVASSTSIKICILLMSVLPAAQSMCCVCVMYVSRMCRAHVKDMYVQFSICI